MPASFDAARMRGEVMNVLPRELSVSRQGFAVVVMSAT
jgi:hypothetical protein